MTPYYLGGYYLIRPKPVSLWSHRLTTVYTASDCINESLLNSWSYAWATVDPVHLDSVKQEYNIDDEAIQAMVRKIGMTLPTR